jgi:hypothetical protein
MKRLTIRYTGDLDDERENDIKRIQDICAEREYLIDKDTAAVAWATFSEHEYCASWMSFTGYSDEDIFERIIRYVYVVDEDEEEE